MGPPRFEAAVDVDRSREIRATFERIRRPLQWPLEDFRRKKFATTRLVGYRFSRMRGAAEAGFVYGFALKSDAVPGVREPPEAVAYAFVRPVGSALFQELVIRPRSAVRFGPAPRIWLVDRPLGRATSGRPARPAGAHVLAEPGRRRGYR